MSTDITRKPKGGLNIVDRTGERYGRLLVISRYGSRGTAATWLCRCDCGREHVAVSNALRSGYTKSCGCSRRTGKNSRPLYRSAHEPGHSAKRTLLKQYRGAARKRGHEWVITDDQFFELTQRPCHYCGVEPSHIKAPSRNGFYKYNGVDRKDNARGYTPDNVVSCCATCNHAKHVMSYEAFKSWIARLVEFAARSWVESCTFGF